MKNTAAFIMPVKLSGDKMELRHFKQSVESIKHQTDNDWLLIMVDDYSDIIIDAYSFHKFCLATKWSYVF